MRISICDNEEKILEYLKKTILTQYPDDEIDCYTSIDQFLNTEHILPYDLLLMDIVFDSADGISAAAKYQAVHPNTYVIFITGYGDRFAQDIFTNVTPCGYLYKPVDITRLFSYLSDIRSKIYSHTLRILPTGESRIDINQNEILYIESDRRKLHIYMSRNEIVCYEKLDEIQHRLCDVFVRCHKSYIVNLTKVARLDSKAFVLYNDTRIPISQIRFTEAKSAYFHMLGLYLQ